MIVTVIMVIMVFIVIVVIIVIWGWSNVKNFMSNQTVTGATNPRNKAVHNGIRGKTLAHTALRRCIIVIVIIMVVVVVIVA
jgi:hypothetical protein